LLGCERFELRATDGVHVITGGDFTTSAGGDVDMRASGLAHCEGK
jgi:hypothetical protein